MRATELCTGFFLDSKTSTALSPRAGEHDEEKAASNTAELKRRFGIVCAHHKNLRNAIKHHPEGVRSKQVMNYRRFISKVVYAVQVCSQADRRYVQYCS